MTTPATSSLARALAKAIVLDVAGEIDSGHAAAPELTLKRVPGTGGVGESGRERRQESGLG